MEEWRLVPIEGFSSYGRIIAEPDFGEVHHIKRYDLRTGREL